MTLKTLKDLQESKGVFVEEGIILHKLKQEAIKRVNNCLDRVYPEGERKGWVVCGSNKKYCKACKRDIWFNNITENDLK